MHACVYLFIYACMYVERLYACTFISVNKFKDKLVRKFYVFFS